MTRQLSCLCALLLAFTCLARARTWYIHPDGSGDVPTIQAGLDSAAVGDTVLLSSGTYYEHDLDMRSDVILRGETGDPRDVSIDAQSQGIVIFCGALDQPARIEGLTITGGLASTETGYDSGAGIYCAGSWMEISRCIFSHNSAEAKGGGLYIGGCSPEITDCTFWDNFAGWQGGAIMCFLAPSPRLTNCTFHGNGAGYLNGGGAMMCWESSPILQNTIIAYGTSGSAIGCHAGDARLSCCNVYGNAGGDGCISGYNGIDGNFSECPSFCNTQNGDFGLCDQSPCLPGNHPAGDDCGLVGAWGQECACGPTKISTTTWSAIKTIHR
jgi:hypothetical protein